MTGDCRDCKDYRNCTQDISWFHYGQIRFCPYQCIWVLANSEMLRAGQWPKDEGSSDSNLGQRSVKTEASFVKPELVIAELEVRLQRCGTQAELLITQVEDGRTFETLSDGAREVLMYAKGFRRKRIGFRRWLRDVYHRSKSGEKEQFLPEKVAI